MSKGRGRAAAATALVLCLVLLHYEVAQATVYNVGGARGWTFKMTSWPDAKRFKAGDVLGLYHPMFAGIYHFFTLVFMCSGINLLPINARQLTLLVSV